MKITVYRGTHQIGGCITEIRTDKTRIVIDVGAELPGQENPEQISIDGVTTGDTRCDAVFITHYHGDHVGLYKELLPEIPVYMGEAAKEIFFALSSRMRDEGVEKIKQFSTFKAFEKIIIGDISITPLPVDHSAYDAYMFLVEGDGKRVLHTGDFRVHGYRGKEVLPMLSENVGTVDLLITEGTSLSRQSKTLLEETELQRQAGLILSENKYVFVLCASTNIDRIAVFYNAVPRGKYFICDEYQKSVLDIVDKYEADENSPYNFKKVHTYGKNLDEKLQERGFCMLVRKGAMFGEVMDKYPDAEFLYSMWDGYIKNENENSQFAQFVKHYPFKPFHTSGHASPTAIKIVSNIVKPRVGILPIHTDSPNLVSELNIEFPVLSLNDNETLEL